jgi:hypothetical protein
MLKGSITISRFHNYRDGDDMSISITLTDETSSTRFLEVRMTPRDFANALTGQGEVGVEFDLRAQHVGKKLEVKTEKIQVSGYAPSTDEIDRLMLEYEVDGWMASADDFHNHHRYGTGKDGSSYYSVSLVRYVEAAQQPPAQG